MKLKYVVPVWVAITALLVWGFWTKESRNHPTPAAPQVSAPAPAPPAPPVVQPEPARTAERHVVKTRIPREQAKKPKVKKRVKTHAPAPAPVKKHNVHRDWFTGEARDDDRWDTRS